MIFNSLGSSFGFMSALSFLFGYGKRQSQDELKEYLADRYSGQTFLYYRGRGALSAAVRATGASLVGVNGFTCYAVPQSVLAADAKPVYLDISKGSYSYGLAELKAVHRGNPGLGAIIIQNTFGSSSDIGPIEAYCSKNGITIIEDLAHCLGMRYKDGREVGTVGAMTMLSFGRDKQIDAVSGGALVVRDKYLAGEVEAPKGKGPLKQRLRDRMYPITTWKIRAFYPVKLGALLQWVAMRLGVIVRSADGPVMADDGMSSLVAARVLKGFAGLEAENIRRRGLVESTGVTLPAGSSPVRMVQEVGDRTGFYSAARSAGYMLYDTWYDHPIYPARLAGFSGYTDGSCPRAEAVADRVINIPLHAQMNESMINQVADIAKDYE